MSKFYTNVKVLGNNICYRGIEDGQRVQYKVEYLPELFIPSPRETAIKSIFGQNVESIKPGTIKDCRDFIKKYEDVDNFTIFGDIGFDVQYISDIFRDKIEWDIKNLSIQILDIETTAENGVIDKINTPEEILLISLLDYNSNHITTFTSRAYTGRKLDNVTIVTCENESELLYKFLDHWNNIHVDIVSGWYTNGFDIPYIINRIVKILGESESKKLSPWNRIYKHTTKDDYGNEDFTYEIVGVSSLDLLELYKKYTPGTTEEDSLEFIAQLELGVGKLDHSEFDSFKEFYLGDYNKFLEYNTIDCQRVYDINKKKNFIELCIFIAYLAKINYEDVASQIRTWDAIIYNHLRSKNMVIPPRSSETKSTKFEGAYVKEPIPGLYDWVLAFDATSLYPSIIQSWNISPETFIGMSPQPITVDGLLNKQYELNPKYCTAANGAMYKKDIKGLFPELVDLYMDMRKFAKGKMLGYQSELEALKKAESTDRELMTKLSGLISRYSVEEQAIKTSLNSLYGAIGNVFCRYFQLENARAITLNGQYIIKTVGNGTNRDLNKMFGLDDFDWAFYNDTDSAYVTVKPIVDKYYKNVDRDKLVDILDKIAKDKITPIINNHCTDIQTYTNAYRHMISFKREAISTRGIFVKKKKYFLYVLDNEGVRYAEPKLKVMGLQVVQSSTPSKVREMLRKSLHLILDSDERTLQDHVSTCKSEFMNLSIKDISFPRGVNGVTKYYDEKKIYGFKCPIQVKGSLLFNHLLIKNKLQLKYPKIQDGDRIKYTYLKEPNPMMDEVISYLGELPKEFELDKYVDYNKQYNKAFLEPINKILRIIGWEAERRNSLDDFF